MAANAQLGSFSYDMLLNIAKFEDSLTKAQRLAEQRMAGIQKTIQGAVDGARDSIKDIAGGIVAAFSVEKLVEAGKKAIEFADSMGKAAEKVGLSVESISALSAQAKLSNVSMDELQAGVLKLSKNAADAAGGNKELANAFATLGIKIKDTNGQLLPTQAILENTAKRFSGFEASALKSADAQVIMGKGAGNLIPLLNELGEKGFAGVTAEAGKFGQVVSSQAAKAANEFNDNITKLEMASSGFAGAVTQKLLPALNEMTGEMVKAAETSDRYSSNADIAANAIKSLILAALGVKAIMYEATTVVLGVYDAVKLTFTSAGQIVDAFADGAKKAMKAAFTFDRSGYYAANDEMKSKIREVSETFVTESAKIKGALKGGIAEAATQLAHDYDTLFGSVKKTTGAITELPTMVVRANAPLIANAAASAEAEAAMKRLNDMLTKDGEILAGLSGKLDPVQAKYQEYVKTIIAANKAYADELDALDKAHAGADKLSQAKANLAAKTLAAQKALGAETAELVKQNDVVGKLFEKLAVEGAGLGLTDREREQAQAVAEATRAWNELNPAIQAYLVAEGKIDPTTAAGTQAIKAQVGTLYDQKKAAELAAGAAKEWQNIWVTAGNGIASTFAKILVEGGSLFDGLKNLAKQTVEAIIEYFAKLAVINPILNAIFGGQGGFSMLPTMMSAMGGGGGGGGAIGGAGGASGGFSLFSPSSWIAAGKSLFSGFGSAGAFAGAQAGGTLTAGGGTGVFAGANAGGTASFVPQYGGYGSAIGQGLGVAGGIYAGYSEFKAAGGGAAGIAGGVAYGVGTYFAGAAVTAGLGAAAAGGLSAGMAAGMAAIPVVGWIALAAMAINMISGGKLFGTSATKFVGGTQTETISDSGGSVGAVGTFKGQRALFGGAYYKEKNIPVSDEARAAATQFFEQLKSSTKAFADSFGVEVGTLVGGTFATTFDKKGKATGTSTTVLGVTRKGETDQQFAERLQADNYLAVLDKMGLGASEFVAGLQEDADKLFQATQDFAQATTAANTNLAAGFHFMALSANQTLPDVINFTKGLVQAGESLSGAYARLVQAQQRYDQFVGQFAKGATYVDPFEAAMAQLYAQMNSDISTANALAVAAGASGASLTDLAHIQQRYAGQMAQVTMQLEQSAQQLAFSLGLTLFGSLDQINAEIDRLTSQTTDASSSVSSFGDAITQTAQKTNEALNLLLGDLSPLNDQQKLQAALGGLRAGTVDAQTVLTIGRRLYASSEAYNTLFAQVQQYAGRATGGGGGGGGGTGHTDTKPVLSDADQKRLNDLMKERDQLEAANRLQQYQTLAQQIAEIAQAKGESFEQVIKEMGVDQAALEKALGISSDADFAKYMDAIAKQVDSNGDNTKSIVDAINQMRIEVVLAVGGKPLGANVYDNPNSVLPNLKPGSATVGGSSGNGNRYGAPSGADTRAQPVNMDDDTVNRFAKAFAREMKDFSDTTPYISRSIRATSAVR